MVDWLAVVGAVGGVVGAVAGIWGAVVAQGANRKALEMKSLDLRIELRRLTDSLGEALQSLSDLIPEAERSRERIAAATGMSRSGAMERWKAMFTAAKAERDALALEHAALLPITTELTPEGMERRLGDVEALKRRAYAQLDKLKESLTADDAARAQLRADRRESRGSH